MRISDWSSDVCSSDLEYRPLASDLSSQSRVQNAFLHPRVHHTFQFDSRQCDETEDDQIWNDRDAHDDRSRSAGFSPGRRAVLRDIRTSPLSDSRSEEHTSELQSLMRNSYAVFCLNKNKTK